MITNSEFGYPSRDRQDYSQRIKDLNEEVWNHLHFRTRAEQELKVVQRKLDELLDWAAGLMCEELELNPKNRQFPGDCGKCPPCKARKDQNDE